MTCPACATENLPGAKFCNECGARLATGCPNCGASNQPGAKFCNECGSRLLDGQSGATGPRGNAEAEARKLFDRLNAPPFTAQLDRLLAERAGGRSRVRPVSPAARAPV